MILTYIGDPEVELGRCGPHPRPAAAAVGERLLVAWKQNLTVAPGGCANCRGEAEFMVVLMPM
jgi:hypothetical protein